MLLKVRNNEFMGSWTPYVSAMRIWGKYRGIAEAAGRDCETEEEKEMRVIHRPERRSKIDSILSLSLRCERVSRLIS